MGAREAHDVIVIGAGPSGLAAARECRRHGVQALLLESGVAVGTRWRERYDGLRLNTVRLLSGLPGMRISRHAGRYPGLHSRLA
jgi:putative flavoprotein involved in K+ transport